MPWNGARPYISCVSAVAVLAAGRAHADEPDGSATYELRYAAVRGCPSESTFRDDALAHVHDTAGSAGARVTVRIDGKPGAFRGELLATDEEGHVGRRGIDGTTCADVAHALAFLAGLAIELGGRLSREEAPPAPEPAPPPPPPPAPPPPPPPPRAPAPAPRRQPATLFFSIAALGEARAGLAPGIRPAASLAFDFGEARVRVLAPVYRVAAVATKADIDNSIGSASLTFLAGRTEACPLRFGDRRVEVRPCLGVEAGHVWAQSHAPTNPKDAGQLWFSGEALLRLKWKILGGLFLEADIAGGVPFVRPQYFFQPDRVLYETPSVTARAAAGLGYAF